MGAGVAGGVLERSAGRLLVKAVDDAGLDRDDVYLTNAVKHFRFTPQRKRRIHQIPDVGHALARSAEAARWPTTYARRVAVLIDPPSWPAHGRLWSHLVSDTSYDELHAFAEQLAVPRRAFEGDHYDVPADRYDALVSRRRASGGVP